VDGAIDPAGLLGNFWKDAATDEVIQDPSGLYATIAGTVMCSHATATSALKDRRLGASPLDDPESLLDRFFNRGLINRDPPEHTAIRRLIARAFTKSAVDAYRPRIQATIDALLDELVPLGRMDLVQDFAARVPLAVICELMGLAPADREGIPQLLSDVEEAFLHAQNEDYAEYAKRGEAATSELYSRFDRALTARIADPGDDLLSRMAAGEAGDDPVEHEDLVANAAGLLGAGQDSTKNTLASCVFELLRHPDQMDLLRRDPSLVPGAVEEALRFHPAIYGAQRRARADLEFAQGTLSAGTKIDFFFGPANRDPAVFPDPDRFDITRTHNPHLSFAAGPHFCVGAPLARVELQLALTALMNRLPGLRLVEQPRWKGLIPFRGLEMLHLRWDPDAPSP